MTVIEASRPGSGGVVHRIVVDGTTVTFVYDDEIQTLLMLGRGEVRRASYVEPAPGGGWFVDMGPSDGPVFGLITPFATRQQALDEERRWLREERGL